MRCSDCRRKLENVAVRGDECFKIGWRKLEKAVVRGDECFKISWRKLERGTFEICRRRGGGVQG
jgi:hypothetical protein